MKCSTDRAPLVAVGPSATTALRRIAPPSAHSVTRHGIDCFTMAPAVAHDFFTDPTTAAAADTFEEAVRQTAREVLPG
jgi:hypothetical protein